MSRDSTGSAIAPSDRGRARPDPRAGRDRVAWCGSRIVNSRPTMNGARPVGRARCGGPGARDCRPAKPGVAGLPHCRRPVARSIAQPSRDAQLDQRHTPSAAPAATPLPHRVGTDASGPRDLAIVPPVGQQQDDPRPLGKLLPGGMPADQLIQLCSLLRRHLDRQQLRTRHRVLLPPGGRDSRTFGAFQPKCTSPSARA